VDIISNVLTGADLRVSPLQAVLAAGLADQEELEAVEILKNCVGRVPQPLVLLACAWQLGKLNHY